LLWRNFEGLFLGGARGCTSSDREKGGERIQEFRNDASERLGLDEILRARKPFKRCSGLVAGAENQVENLTCMIFESIVRTCRKLKSKPDLEASVLNRHKQPLLDE
jgi:hypothetical protein